MPALMTEGCSTEGICARASFLSSKTVGAHVSHIFSRMGVEESPADHRRVLAVLALDRQSQEFFTALRRWRGLRTRECGRNPPR